MMITIIVSIIIALIGASGGFIALYQNRQLKKQTEILGREKADSEVFKRAQTIYEAAIKQLEAQVVWLKHEQETMQGDNLSLKRRVREFESIIAQMRYQLIAAGVDVALIPVPSLA